jgi:hypothetical protein
MARRLHGDEGLGGRTEHPEQLGVPVGVFGERRRLEEASVALVDHRHDLSLRRLARPDVCDACRTVGSLGCRDGLFLEIVRFVAQDVITSRSCSTS